MDQVYLYKTIIIYKLSNVNIKMISFLLKKDLKINIEYEL